MMSLPSLIIIVGHYGVGKTNLALNLALLQRGGKTDTPFEAQTLVDLDIVNPYYRAGDHARELAAHGISVLGPVHGASNLDTPSLMPGISSVIERSDVSHPVLVDVGGDPDGARALARFSEEINAHDDRVVLYVVNNMRPELATAEDAVALLREIEKTAGVRATHIVGNTHLREQTTPELIAGSIPYVQAVASAAELPLAFVTVPRSDLQSVETLVQGEPLLPLDVLVGNLWDDLTAV